MLAPYSYLTEWLKMHIKHSFMNGILGNIKILSFYCKIYIKKYRTIIAQIIILL